MIKATLFILKKLKNITAKIIPKPILKMAKKQISQLTINKCSRIKYQNCDFNKFPKGINLVGMIKAENGLGQSTRLIASAIENSKLDFTIYNYEQISSVSNGDNSWVQRITNTTPFNINVIHINPADFAIAKITLPNSIWDFKYNIAFWLWELEDFPDEWIGCFNLVNEIWTPSEFVSNSIRKKTTKPVITIPYSITAEIEAEFDRTYFGLPQDKFLFLCLYDCNSGSQRKNPLGAINAYKKAFDVKNNQVGLIVKMNNPSQKDIDFVKNELLEYNNIFIINKTLTKPEINSLISVSNVFVSLHRSEGFGLVIAEAMLLGTPTIATNWSANTEFCTKETCCLVDFEFVKLNKDYSQFKKGNRWAEPNINTAADYMIKLFTDNEYYNDILIKGKNQIIIKLNLDNASALIENRIEQLYKENKKTVV